MASKKKESLDLTRLVTAACEFLEAYAANLHQIIVLRAQNEERLNKQTDELINKLLGPIPSPTKQETTQPEFDDLTKVFGK